MSLRNVPAPSNAPCASSKARAAASGRRRAPALFAACALAYFGLGSSCLVFVERGNEQCSTDGDCATLGGDFQGTFCNEQKVCQRLEAFCSTNSECIDRYGVEDYICRKQPNPNDNSCVKLTDQLLCPRFYAEPGDLRNDETVIVGVLWMSSWADVLAASEKSMDMVRQEFRETLEGGLPPVPGKSKPRPVGWLVCDIPFGQQNLHPQATDHLIDEVGVPVMLGPLLPDWLSYTVPKAIDKKVAVFTTDPAYEGFVDVPGRVGFLFGNTMPSSATPYTHALLIQQVVEQRLRDAGRTGPLKVAFVSSGVGISIEDERVFRETVRFNEKSAAQNGADYLSSAYGNSAAPTFAASFSASLGEVKNFQPDVVACSGAECASFAIQLEREIPGKTFFLLPFNAQAEGVANLFGVDESARSRVLGTFAGDSLENPDAQDFFLRYSDRFKNNEFPRHGALAFTYDMAYYMMYAMAGVDTEPLTGDKVGQVVLQRFRPGGFSTKTYPTKIPGTVKALRSGQTIDVDGTMGVGNFDEQGNVVKYDVPVWCVAPPDRAREQFVDAGMSYHSDTDQLSGTIDGCKFPPAQPPAPPATTRAASGRSPAARD
jgi:hypothetical protein